MQFNDEMNNSYPDSRLSSSAGSTGIEIVGNRINTSFLQAQWASWVDESARDICVCCRDADPHGACENSLGRECHCQGTSMCPAGEGTLGGDESAVTWTETATPDARSLSTDKRRCALPAGPVLEEEEEEDDEDDDMELTSVDAAVCARQAVMATQAMMEAAQQNDLCTNTTTTTTTTATAITPLLHAHAETRALLCVPNEVVARSTHPTHHHVTPHTSFAPPPDRHHVEHHTCHPHTEMEDSCEDELDDELVYAGEVGSVLTAMHRVITTRAVHTHEHDVVDSSCDPRSVPPCLDGGVPGESAETSPGVADTIGASENSRSAALPDHRAVACVSESDEEEDDLAESAGLRMSEKEATPLRPIAGPRVVGAQDHVWVRSSRAAGTDVTNGVVDEGEEGVPRMEQGRQDFYGAVIGRGGDRGSSVYRVCVPHARRAPGAAEEWAAQKVYPRHMLRNEVEFTETVSRWRRAHRCGVPTRRGAGLHTALRGCGATCRGGGGSGDCVTSASEVGWMSDRGGLSHAPSGSASSWCEECYAASHLVLADAIVVIDGEDRGVIMPLYDCSLKHFLLRIDAPSRLLHDHTADHSSTPAHSYYNYTPKPAALGSVHHTDKMNHSQGLQSGHSGTTSSEASGAGGGVEATAAPSTRSLSSSSTEDTDEEDGGTLDYGHRRRSSRDRGVDRGELLPPPSCSAFLYRRNYLPIRTTKVISAIVFQLLVAVAWMHDRLPHRAYGGALCTGYVHNDIHLSNILLDLRSGRVALCDFELASHASARRGSARMAVNEVGSRLPPYSRQSPHGLLCPEADTWAVGLVILNLLTGIDPFLSNEAIMDDFGNGPLLMPYSSPNRPPHTPVLDWEGNMRAHARGLLAHGPCHGASGYDESEMHGLFGVCAGCFANNPSTQPCSARELLHHAVFDPFRRERDRAENTVLEWIHSQVPS